jgi:hypothetical protein
MSFNNVPDIKNGTDGKINKIITKDRYTYICGNFTSVNNIATVGPQITYYNSSHKEYKCIGYVNKDGNINYIVEHNNCIYVAGSFSSISDIYNNTIESNGLAFYDKKTETWNAVIGFQKNAIINSIIFDKNSDMYIAGVFNIVDSNFVENIVRMRNGKWDILNDGLTYCINDLCIIDDYLYIGGRGKCNIKKLNILTNLWEPISDLNIQNTINVLYANQNTLFIAGNFEYVLNYNITNKSCVKIGPILNENESVSVLSILKTDDILYIGGTFTCVGDNIAVNGLTSYDCNTNIWVSFSEYFNETNVTIHNLSILNSELYISGSFTYIYPNDTGIIYENIAKYDGMGITPLNQMAGPNNIVSHIEISNDNSIYMCGNYTTIHGIHSAGLAIYDNITREWKGCGYAIYRNMTNGEIKSMYIFNDDIYVIGEFTNFQNYGYCIYSKNIAKYNLSTNRWVSITNDNLNGLSSGYLNCLLVDDNYLYIGGEFESIFTSKGTFFSSGVARLELKTDCWKPMGNNNNFIVYDMALGETGNVYVTGNLLYNTKQSGIVLWDKYIEQFCIPNITIKRQDNKPVIIKSILINDFDLIISGNFDLVGDNINTNIGLAVFNKKLMLWKTISNSSIIDANTDILSFCIDKFGNICFVAKRNQIILVKWDYQSESQNSLSNIDIQLEDNIQINYIAENSTSGEIILALENNNSKNICNNICKYCTETKYIYTLPETLCYFINKIGDDGYYGTITSPLRTIKEASKRSNINTTLFINRNIFVELNDKPNKYYAMRLYEFDIPTDITLTDGLNNSITKTMGGSNKKYLFYIFKNLNEIIDNRIKDTNRSGSEKAIAAYLYYEYSGIIGNIILNQENKISIPKQININREMDNTVHDVKFVRIINSHFDVRQKPDKVCNKIIKSYKHKDKILKKQSPHIETIVLNTKIAFLPNVPISGMKTILSQIDILSKDNAIPKVEPVELDDTFKFIPKKQINKIPMSAQQTIHSNINSTKVIIPDYNSYTNSILGGNGSYIGLFTKKADGSAYTLTHTPSRNSRGIIIYNYIPPDDSDVIVLTTKTTPISHGEPHVFPFIVENGIEIYDLPDIDQACFRLIDYKLSGTRLIVNCLTKKLTLDDFPDELYVGNVKKNKYMIDWLEKFTYYDKIYIKYNESTIIINMDTHETIINDNINIFECTKTNEKYISLPDRVYPLTYDAKCLVLDININGEYLQLKMHADKNIDDRNCLIMSNSNLEINVDSNKSRFRGCLYKKSDCKQIKNLYDDTDIYNYDEKVEMMNKQKRKNMLRRI